jgi:hypothetical protein
MSMIRSSKECFAGVVVDADEVWGKFSMLATLEGRGKGREP